MALAVTLLAHGLSTVAAFLGSLCLYALDLVVPALDSSLPVVVLAADALADLWITLDSCLEAHTVALSASAIGTGASPLLGHVL